MGSTTATVSSITRRWRIRRPWRDSEGEVVVEESGGGRSLAEEDCQGYSESRHGWSSSVNRVATTYFYCILQPTKAFVCMRPGTSIGHQYSMSRLELPPATYASPSEANNTTPI